MDAFTYSYGPEPSQFLRLYLPAGADLPVVVVIHGGFWRQRYGIELADPLAAQLTEFGVAAAAVEYRRVGPEGTGGWPTTLADVAAAVDSLAGAGQRLAGGRLRLSAVVAVGHSAGGQLAAWLAHRNSLPPATPGSFGSLAPVAVTGAVSQAGVLDLVGGARERLGNGAVEDMMGGSPASWPERYANASPLAHVGDGARIVCVHGDADDVVPISQSERYAAAARAAGDPVELVALPGHGPHGLGRSGPPGLVRQPRCGTAADLTGLAASRWPERRTHVDFMGHQSAVPPRREKAGCPPSAGFPRAGPARSVRTGCATRQ